MTTNVLPAMDYSILISIGFVVHLALLLNTCNLLLNYRNKIRYWPFPGSAKQQLTALYFRYFLVLFKQNKSGLDGAASNTVWLHLKIQYISHLSENWSEFNKNKTCVSAAIPTKRQQFLKKGQNSEVMSHEQIFDLHFRRHVSAYECNIVCQLWCINDGSGMQEFHHICSQTWNQARTSICIVFVELIHNSLVLVSTYSFPWSKG